MSAEHDPEIMTIDEAAQLLRVSVKTFNKVLHTESIPARKIGREWKFSRKALIAWIGDGRSDEFYREAQAADGRPSKAPGTNGTRAKGGTGDSVRRTSGWRLELD